MKKPAVSPGQATRSASTFLQAALVWHETTGRQHPAGVFPLVLRDGQLVPENLSEITDSWAKTAQLGEPIGDLLNAQDKVAVTNLVATHLARPNIVAVALVAEVETAKVVGDTTEEVEEKVRDHPAAYLAGRMSLGEHEVPPPGTHTAAMVMIATRSNALFAVGVYGDEESGKFADVSIVVHGDPNARLMGPLEPEAIFAAVRSIESTSQTLH